MSDFSVTRVDFDKKVDFVQDDGNQWININLSRRINNHQINFKNQNELKWIMYSPYGISEYKKLTTVFLKYILSQKADVCIGN